ncbi:hypothetical protein BJF78_21395 [Pseudonocardia sp. CNS-139]|nr:hypothetical protein BJF78_21395 [Pseudonocardia sp. CNS-139]
MVRGLAWDVALPLVGYYALHLLGVDDWTALLVATLLAGARIAWTMLRDRAFNPFATVMLVVFGLGLLLAFVSGDARFVLLKDSILTGGIGLVFLVTTAAGRPLTLAAAKTFQPGGAAHLDEVYRTNPGARRAFRLTSVVWGAGLLTEALVRVPLIYTLPVSVMVGLSQALSIATIGGLIAWNVWYTRRIVRRRLSRTRPA